MGGALPTSVDLKVLHIICSRLCHDLVGPVGAVNNGLELMREFGADDAESMDLVSGSAAQLSARLQYFRVAYGLASGAARSVADVRGLAAPWFETEGIALDWPGGEHDAKSLDIVGIKVILNTLVMAKECLVREGGVAVTMTPNSGGLRLVATVSGPGARLKDELAEGLAPELSIDDLTPRNVQGYFTRMLASDTGGDIEVSCETDRVAFAATIPLDE